MTHEPPASGTDAWEAPACPGCGGPLRPGRFAGDPPSLRTSSGDLLPMGPEDGTVEVCPFCRMLLIAWPAALRERLRAEASGPPCPRCSRPALRADLVPPEVPAVQLEETTASLHLGGEWGLACGDCGALFVPEGGWELRGIEVALHNRHVRVRLGKGLWWGCLAGAGAGALWALANWDWTGAQGFLGTAAAGALLGSAAGGVLGGLSAFGLALLRREDRVRLA